MRIAVLFCDPTGVYSTMDVDCWGKDRDARNYEGLIPVVAHPPCQLWGRFAKINYARWGGEHNKPGNDGGCFAFALAAVRRCGGVLEHPADSYAWFKYDLPRPPAIGWVSDDHNGYACEVWQSAYGHKANKRTWLYYSGRESPMEMNWKQPEGTHQIGQHNSEGQGKPVLSGKAASATPPAFAQALIELAWHSNREQPLSDEDFNFLHSMNQLGKL